MKIYSYRNIPVGDIVVITRLAKRDAYIDLFDKCVANHPMWHIGDGDFIDLTDDGCCGAYYFLDGFKYYTL